MEPDLACSIHNTNTASYKTNGVSQVPCSMHAVCMSAASSVHYHCGVVWSTDTHNDMNVGCVQGPREKRELQIGCQEIVQEALTATSSMAMVTPQ